MSGLDTGCRDVGSRLNYKGDATVEVELFINLSSRQKDLMGGVRIHTEVKQEEGWIRSVWVIS